MTEENKRLFNQFLDWMEPHGNTNLWAGLKLGLDFLTDGISVHRHNALFLFTDGEPTIVPPRGFIPMLTQYKEKHGIKGVINTFGFGYDLDSHLLRDLAREGGGTYSFIPDASFVGTIFIHSTANLLSTYASSVSVRIEPMYAAVLDRDIPGGHLAQWTSNVMDLDLGTMRYDQPKDLALLLHRVPPKNTPYVRVTVTYKTILSEQIHSLAVEGITWEAQSSDLDYHLNRLHFVDVLNSVLSHSPHQPAKRKIPAKLAAKAKARPAAAPATPADSTQQDLNAVLSEGIAALADLAEEIRESGVTEPRVVALLADIEGQGTLALRLEYYQRWGRHYLPSLASAHFHQFCNNFKDPGVQVYARGQLFSTLRDSIDELFCSLPAPTPSNPVPPVPSATGVSGHAPVSMRSFNDSSNPCFAGDSLVLLADGSHRRVQDVRRGDRVACGARAGACVVCVVVSPCRGGQASLVALPGGLHVTPWHPIRINGQWRFPSELRPPTLVPCPAVFSFVLDEGHVATINGVECVTLGHAFHEPVVHHEFFGTSSVVACLVGLEGWTVGRVRVDGVMRDPATGRACGLLQSPTSIPEGVPIPQVTPVEVAA